MKETPMELLSELCGFLFGLAFLSVPVIIFCAAFKYLFFR